MSAKVVLGALLALSAGCAKVTEVATVPDLAQVGQVASPVDIVLSVGTEVRVDALLRVGFVDVPADSRCPTSVACVWMGDGHVVLGVGAGEGASYAANVHTAIEPGAVEMFGYRVTLLDLTPYPAAPGAIDLDEYAVRLRVERLP